MDDERAADDYFDALAGRKPGGPGAAALREALLAQGRTLREAEQASAADLDADERAKMDALKQRLLAAGAWRSAEPARDSSSPTRVEPARDSGGPVRSVPRRRLPALLSGLRELLAGAGWQRSLALAAGVLLASALALRLSLPDGDDDPSQTLRGPPGHVIRAADPEARARALDATLRSLGAETLLVPINPREWTLSVGVPDGAKLPAVQQALREAGFKPVGAPPYELSVRGAGRD